MKQIIGDLLEVRSGVVLHQVNCRGVLGGLAAALAQRWPAAFTAYHRACRQNGAFAFGTFALGEADPGLFVGHVFGQLNPGPCTDINAVGESLGFAMEVVPDLPVYAPWKMGCGIGGGDWPEYSARLEICFPEVTIVQRPEDAR